MSQTCLYNISYKKATRYIYNSYYRGHLALVQHKPSFATVHSRVTVGGSSVECEYKLLPQFARLHAPPGCLMPCLSKPPSKKQSDE